MADSVFAHLGIRSYKDKVMEKPGAQNGAVPWLAMPAVIFPHWREVLNQFPLSPAARAGYALAIAGYLYLNSLIFDQIPIVFH